MEGNGHSERMASLAHRVEALRRTSAEVRRRRHVIRHPVTAQTAVTTEDPDPASQRESDSEKFRRTPELVLGGIALLGLLFFPTDALNQLDPEALLAVVILIPFLLAGFVLGGAALWRAFRNYSG
jgi:hypothetical protein